MPASAAAARLRLPSLSPRAGHKWLDHFKWAAIAAVAIGIPTILLRALAGLRRFLLDINILMTVAVAGVKLHIWFEGSPFLWHL